MEPVYEYLVRLHRDRRVDFFGYGMANLDEFVGLAANDSRSFLCYMDRHLFSKANLRPENTHLPDGTTPDPVAECARYERLLAGCGVVDLRLLGIDLNGHIGFNEPPAGLRSRAHVQVHSPITRAQNVPPFSRPDQVPPSAITMGVGTILESRRCLALVTGAEKAEVAARAIESLVSSLAPASSPQLHPDCTVVLDQPAASRLAKAGQVGAFV